MQHKPPPQMRQRGHKCEMAEFFRKSSGARLVFAPAIPSSEGHDTHPKNRSKTMSACLEIAPASARRFRRRMDINAVTIWLGVMAFYATLAIIVLVRH